MRAEFQTSFMFLLQFQKLVQYIMMNQFLIYVGFPVGIPVIFQLFLVTSALRIKC